MAPVIVLGEDLAGLALAWHLRQQGYTDFIHLAESGSPADPVSWNWSPAFPSGPAADWIEALLGADALLPAMEWGCWQDRFVGVPVEAHLADLPPETARDWLLGFVQAQQGGVRRRQDRRGSTAEEWLRESFGLGIAEGFWLPYLAKRTTAVARELVASAATGWLAPASLEDVVDGALTRAARPAKGRDHFIAGGFARIGRELSRSIPSRAWSGNAEIDLGRRTVRLETGEQLEYDQLVSSLPLPRLGKMLRDAPDDVRSALASLRSAECLRTTLSVTGPLPEPRFVVFPGPEHRFHRVFVEPQDSGEPARVCLDIAAPAGHSVENIAPDEAERALRAIGMLATANRVVASAVQHIENEFAIQDNRHHQSVRVITQFLEDHGVITLGPLGAWNNAGIEATLATAERVGRAVIHSQQHGLALRAPERMPLVSIVIPVYKEEACLEQYTLQIIEAVDKLQLPYELILAENGGRDRTGEIADRLAARFRQVRAVHYPEPNYGKALAMGILNATGENVVCFEIDFWDAEFVEIAQVLLKKYDAVIGSKRAPGARDRRPFLRRTITTSFNLFLKLIYGFQGTDTHGIKGFRREQALPIVRACATGKDIFATELVLRMERAGLYICEMPLEIQELRSPSINLLKRVPSTIRNLIALWRATRKLPRTDFRKMEPAPKVSILS